MRSIPGTYTPHRGSYPEAAYKVLGEHAELSTSALADAIGCTAHSIPALMTIPLRHGMLARTKRDGLIWWSRAAPMCPPPRPADDEDDEPLHGKPGANGKLPASSIFDLAERQAKIEPARAPQAAGPATPLVIAPPKLIAPAFRVGLFSDGQLRIEWRGQLIELEREQTEQLVRFLDRLAPEGAE